MSFKKKKEKKNISYLHKVSEHLQEQEMGNMSSFTILYILYLFIKYITKI